MTQLIDPPSDLAATPTSAAPLTPMMVQWKACKDKHPGVLLFFRLGDFYEAFHEDAAVMAKELGIALTQRQGTSMCGVPYHTVDTQIDKLVQRGYRVAIADQLEDPKETKGLVKRGVTRVISPGSLIESNILKEKQNNFFVAITAQEGDFGLAFVDVSTGEFQTTLLSQRKDLHNEIYRLRPSELLCSLKFARKNADLLSEIKADWNCAINQEEEWYFDAAVANKQLCTQFKVETLLGFGIESDDASVTAAGALLRYLEQSLSLSTQHITRICRYDLSQMVAIDRMTQRNLELFVSLRDGSQEHTLIAAIDGSVTPMGGRLLNAYLRRPLRDIEAIDQRLDMVQRWKEVPMELQQLRGFLEQVRDCQRIATRVTAGNITPRDLVILRNSLACVQEVEVVCRRVLPQTNPYFKEATPSYAKVEGLVNLLSGALVDAPPPKLGEGESFRRGYCLELDELLELKQNGKDWLTQYQQRLREETGIKTLKVGFNRVFGYYIEVSTGQTDRMPEYFIRRQTLTNGERYISPELKTYEDKILNAEERVNSLESKLFAHLKEVTASYGEAIVQISGAVAQIDLLQGFAWIAIQRHYIRPNLVDTQEIQIKEGRHPVVERACGAHQFVPNDLIIDGTNERLLVITGPNMGGKSTYMRQIALLVLMAQIGSFIPASSATIGVVDKIFSRIGASDDLARGHSTFMVEMTETANILNNATDRSLVILDEIGRGTSTYDGIAIAWAVAEYLLTEKGQQARVLFATHYWELTQLPDMFPGACNYHVKVAEKDGEIKFLHKVAPGIADRSYGIHVAKIAGLPGKVLERANLLLNYLEKSSGEKGHPCAPSLPTKRNKKLFAVGQEQASIEQLALFSGKKKE